MTTTPNHVSNANKLAAKAAIVAKREQLEHWSRTGLPFKGGAAPAAGEPYEFDWYPQSLRDFCRWDGSQNDPKIGPFRATAFQTLGSYPEEKATVTSLLAVLEKLRAATIKRLDPRAALRDAEGQVLIERQLRAGALLGYRAARQQVRVLAASLADEQRAHRESIAHLSEQLEKAHRDVAALSAEVAALTATIRKVKPIRAVG